MDVYFKETPSNGRPSNTFKVTMIGTSSVSGTFSWNFGNPNSFPITCDNTKHILTYGTAGLNFTDATNFNATCTTTSVSFTIGIGAFRIDPTTIGTGTSVNTIRQYQGAICFASTRYWVFYFDGTNQGWRSSTDGITWSSFTSVTITYVGPRRVTWWCSGMSSSTGSIITYASNEGSASQARFFYRYGTLNTDGTITWTISETSVTTTGNTDDFPKIVQDSNNNFWVATQTTNSGLHLEVWEGTSCSNLCTWSKSLDLSGQAIGNLIPITSGKLGLIYNAGGSNAYGVIFFSGSSWGSSASNGNPSARSFQVGMSTSIGDTLKVASNTGVTCYYNSIPYSTTPTWGSTTTIEVATGATGSSPNCAISSDNSQILVYYVISNGGYVHYYLSSNSGSTWSNQQVILGNTVVNAITNSPLIMSNLAISAWGAGSASPYNIQFQFVNIRTPLLIQSTSCTFTGSSGNCAFSANTASGHAVLVIAGDIVSTTVSTVTDTQLLTYSLIVSKDTGTVGDIEGWCAEPTTASPDTITVSYSISVTATIILYEIGSACNVSSSSGSGTTVSSASVSSYTPVNPSIVIGALNSGCQVACTVSAGTSYVLDKTVNTGATNTVDTEYIQNLGTAETTPFTFSVASSYNEISIAFTQNIQTSISDATIASESILRTPKPILADSTLITDSIIKFTKPIISDSITASESILRTAIPIFADSFSIAESAFRGAIENLNEAFNIVVTIPLFPTPVIPLPSIPQDENSIIWILLLVLLGTIFLGAIIRNIALRNRFNTPS